MSNETKRDVFDELLKMYRNSMALTHEEPVILDNDGYDVFGKIEKSYDAALPDDLPVIPKEVGEYIERQKKGSTLRSAIIAATDFHAVDDEEADWIFYHSDTFALAWLLGVWRVEETGEIVKLEAQK